MPLFPGPPTHSFTFHSVQNALKEEDFNTVEQVHQLIETIQHKFSEQTPTHTKI